MKQSFFEPGDNRTNFFLNSSDGEKLFEFLFLLIKVTSIKRGASNDAIGKALNLKINNVRGQISELCDDIYLKFLPYFQSHTLYKLAYAHSECRIEELSQTLVDIEVGSNAKEEQVARKVDLLTPGRLSEKLNSRISKKAPVNLRDFTDQEKEEMRQLLETVFCISSDLIPEDLTPAVACELIKETAAYKAKKSDRCHVFFSVLFDEMARSFGFFSLADKANTEKYDPVKLSLVTEEGSTVFDLLREWFGFLFGVVFSTQEQSDEIERLSAYVDKRYHKGDGAKVESITGNFGQVTKGLPRLIPEIMKRSDDRGLREKVARALVAAKASSHNIALEKQRILKKAADISNELEGKVHSLTVRLSAEPARVRAQAKIVSKPSWLLTIIRVLLEKLFGTKKRLSTANNHLLEKKQAISRLTEKVEEQEAKLDEQGIELTRLRSELEKSKATLAKKNTQIANYSKHIQIFRTMALVGLQEYRLMRANEARGRDGKVRDNHRHGKVCWGYTYDEKEQSAKMFENYVKGVAKMSDVRSTFFGRGKRRSVIGAWKNKRLSKVVSEYARKSLIAHGSNYRGSDRAVIDEWIRQEELHEQKAAMAVSQ